MTIAVAIRTESAVVFAADSKITTSGVVGLEENGTPRWVEQTYDNATKVAHDQTKTYMAMVAGNANIGRITATEFISMQQLPLDSSLAQQDERVVNLVNAMVTRKRDYWATIPNVPPENWPGPTILLAGPKPSENAPRVWRVRLAGPDAETTEILTEPGLRLEGSYDEVFTLVYGWAPNILEEICNLLSIKREQLDDALRRLRILRPIDKLNLWAIPIQDAIDLAVFLASVQVQMDRFLPGTAACGGPIDVMVLQMAPQPGIVAYPGKLVHHPNA